MAWLRRLAVLAAGATLAAPAFGVLAADPPQAKANVVCEVGISPGAAVTGALGIGNPVGDVCNELTDPVLGAAEEAALGPLKDAARSIGQGVFKQITSWVGDGAVWLLSEVVELTERTTAPNLLSKGFLVQYRKMASIAVALAAMMLILAVFDSLGRGDAGMLGRVFLVHVPLAALATSAAYVVVQLLVATTDGFSEVIAHSTSHDSREFFKGAVEALASAGAEVGSAADESRGAPPAAGAAEGTVAVPLFVGFIAAVLAAIAAFLVWIELLMRSAAIYAVALFMPIVLAAAIRPKWASAMRRTAELLFAIITSKFVIVAVIALAASLAAKGEGIEQVLVAAALLLVACFAPLVLIKFMPYAEGALGAAFHRQSAGGTSLQIYRHGASSVQMMRGAARANWRGASAGGGPSEGRGKQAARSTSGAGPGQGGDGPRAGGGGAASGVASGATGAAALPVAAAGGVSKAIKGTADRLRRAAAAQDAGADAGSTPEVGSAASSVARPAARGEAVKAEAARIGAAPTEGGPAPSGATAAVSRSTRAEKGRRPTIPDPSPREAPGGSAPTGGRKPPRPSGEATAPPSNGPAEGTVRP